MFILFLLTVFIVRNNITRTIMVIRITRRVVSFKYFLRISVKENVKYKIIQYY